MSKAEVWIWRIVLVGLIIFQSANYFNIMADRKMIYQQTDVLEGIIDAHIADIQSSRYIVK